MNGQTSGATLDFHIMQARNTAGTHVPAVTLHGLSKRYGSGPLALDCLTLEVQSGEIFGYLGPNGAGKTTTIRLMLDLIRPTSGASRVFGFDSRTQGTEVRSRVGYLSGELSLYWGYTGKRLLDLYASLRPNRIDWDYITGLCTRLDVALDKPIGHLSHGNRQKVGLVIALMSQPELLILDEPTSGLDPLAQHQVLEILREVRQQGRTVFFSSHNLPEVERICDRVGIIRSGRLVAVERVETLTAQHIHRIQLNFATAVPGGRFAGLPGVQVLDHTTRANTVRLEITGDMDAVIKEAARHRLVSIESEQPSLEDTFLELYEGDGELETEHE
jgi:ABC-2 type transport system ATP-binding protein